MTDKDDAGGEQKKEHFTRHPLFISVVAALIGLVVGLITTNLSGGMQLSQYWRDKRLEVYSAYFDAVRETSEARFSISVQNDSIEANGYKLPANTEIDALHQMQLKAVAAETLLAEKQQPVFLIGGQGVREAAGEYQGAYENVTLAFTALYLDMKDDGRTSEARTVHLRQQIRLAMESSSGGFLNTMREELGVR